MSSVSSWFVGFIWARPGGLPFQFGSFGPFEGAVGFIRVVWLDLFSFIVFFGRCLRLVRFISVRWVRILGVVGLIRSPTWGLPDHFGSLGSFWRALCVSELFRVRSGAPCGSSGLLRFVVFIRAPWCSLVSFERALG